MPPRPTHSTDDLAALLRARGQRVTSQRLVILRELRRRGRHATAHEVAQAVRRDLPGTSTPTVYATLDLLAELGLIRKLCLGTDAALYDARTQPHQHVICRRCGRVEDLDVEIEAPDAIDAARAHGFTAERTELVVTGYCADCAATSAPADAVA